MSKEAIEHFYLDITHLDKGIYYMELCNRKKYETVKLVKM